MVEVEIQYPDGQVEIMSLAFRQYSEKFYSMQMGYEEMIMEILSIGEGATLFRAGVSGEF